MHVDICVYESSQTPNMYFRVGSDENCKTEAESKKKKSPEVGAMGAGHSEPCLQKYIFKIYFIP